MILYSFWKLSYFLFGFVWSKHPWWSAVSIVVRFSISLICLLNKLYFATKREALVGQEDSGKSYLLVTKLGHHNHYLRHWYEWNNFAPCLCANMHIRRSVVHVCLHVLVSVSVDIGDIELGLVLHFFLAYYLSNMCVYRKMKKWLYSGQNLLGVKLIGKREK